MGIHTLAQDEREKETQFSDIYGVAWWFDKIAFNGFNYVAMGTPTFGGERTTDR